MITKACFQKHKFLNWRQRDTMTHNNEPGIKPAPGCCKTAVTSRDQAAYDSERNRQDSKEKEKQCRQDRTTCQKV